MAVMKGNAEQEWNWGKHRHSAVGESQTNGLWY